MAPPLVSERHGQTSHLCAYSWCSKQRNSQSSFFSRLWERETWTSICFLWLWKGFMSCSLVSLGLLNAPWRAVEPSVPASSDAENRVIRPVPMSKAQHVSCPPPYPCSSRGPGYPWDSLKSLSSQQKPQTSLEPTVSLAGLVRAYLLRLVGFSEASLSLGCCLSSGGMAAQLCVGLCSYRSGGRESTQRGEEPSRPHTAAALQPG